MQEFNINKNSTLPYLEMELIQDGRNDYKKAYYALQNADVYFTMVNLNSGVKVISNSKCDVITYMVGCEERVKLRYSWKSRDTKIEGRYIGTFKIVFNDDIYSEEYQFPKGELIVPISEELVININNSMINTN